MNKRGISDVITTVLIILLVLAAIVIVWQAVKGTITTATKGITTDCLTLQLKIDTLTKSTNATNSDGIVTVKRDVGAGEIKGIKVLVNGVSVADKTVSSTDLPELGTFQITGVKLLAGDNVNIAGTVGENDVLCAIADTKSIPVA